MARIVLIMLALLVPLRLHAAEARILRFGFETPRTDSQFVGAARLAELVRERSGGRLEIKLFPASVLGDGLTMLAATRDGTLDMYMGGGYFANLAGKLNIVDIPFLFTGYPHVDRVLGGPIGREMLDELEQFGLVGLAFWENGFRCLTNSRRPVKAAKDVDGLRLRTLANPMHVETWKLLGAWPTPMALAELYTALEHGMVEAQEHPLNVTYSAKLYEVQKYISITNHVYTPLILAINAECFAGLPEDLRAILCEAALEAAQTQKQYIRNNIAQNLEKMRKYGCEVVPEDEVDIGSFAARAGKPARDIYLKEYGGDTGERWLEAIDRNR